jgi:site-specific recombinase XerD
MDQPAPRPLIRSFERHLRSENRSERTIATYLIALRQADAFLRPHGTTIEAATRADLEAFMGDLLARRAASTAATYYRCSNCCTPGWSRNRNSTPAPWRA